MKLRNKSPPRFFISKTKFKGEEKMKNIDYCMCWIRNLVNNERDIADIVENVFINLSARSHLVNITNDALPIVEFCLDNCMSTYESISLPKKETNNLLYELNAISIIFNQSDQKSQSDFFRNYAEAIENGGTVQFILLTEIICENWKFLKGNRITYQLLACCTKHINLNSENATKLKLIQTLSTVILQWEHCLR